MNLSRSNILPFAAAVAFFLATSFAVIRLGLPHAFIWIWLSALPAVVIGAVRGSPWFRRLCVVGLGLFSALAIAEIAFAVAPSGDRDNIVTGGTYNRGGFLVPAKELGYTPAAGSRVTHTKTRDGEIVYDVAYTISDTGVRATPGNPLGDTWIFAGCSFMFGEGLEDDQTLPSRFSALLGFRANVVNMAVQGYGPHHMLRALELGRVDSLIGGPVRGIVYEAFWDHVPRSAGRKSWDSFGPSYTLSGDTVAFAGPFQGGPGALALKIARRSALGSLLLDRALYRMTDADIERFVRILERTERVAQTRYGAALTVIYWDEPGVESSRVLNRLRKTGLHLLLVSRATGRTDFDGLFIPFDGHPNAGTNELLAHALLSDPSARSR